MRPSPSRNDFDGTAAWLRAARRAALAAVLVGSGMMGGLLQAAPSGTGTGSGFVVHPDGFIVTCAHVAADASQIEVRLGGRSYPARVLAADEELDLALVKIEGKGLPVVPLGDSDRLQLAEDLRGVGYPLAGVLGTSIKISRGSLSGFVQEGPVKLLQIDVPINPGNSGGPLVNNRGEVVGVASAKLAGAAVSNVGFAVPSNAVRKMLDGKKVAYETRGARRDLDGPDLARQVTPAVALVKVTISPQGPLAHVPGGPSRPPGETSPPPATPPDEVTQTPERHPEPPPARRADRLAVPTGQPREQAEALVGRVFGPRMEAARSSDEKVALAREMLQVARDEKDPVQRFATLNRARVVAVESGNLAAALDLVEEMIEGYRLDEHQARQAVLLAVGRHVTDQQQWQELAELAAEMLDDAVGRDDFRSAGQLYQAAQHAARRVKDFRLLRELVTREPELRRLGEVYAKLASYRETLAAKPDDPAASLMLGKYRCFMKKDWEAGLPLLARGSDERLRRAAAAELADPATTEDIIKLADQWWAIAEADRSELKDVIRARALWWYEGAVGDLSGLKKAEVEQRLDQYADLLTAQDGPGEQGTSASLPRAASGNRLVQLMDHLAGQVKQNRTLKTEEHGFKLGGTAFECVAQEGGLLVGFDVSLGTFKNIQAVRPIFLTSKGYVRGPIYGPPTPASLTLAANRGYAVGKIALSPGIGIDGLQLQLMKIEDGGLNAEDAYQTPWCGKSNANQVALGDGRPIVGIFGRRDERRLLTLGLVLAEKAP